MGGRGKLCEAEARVQTSVRWWRTRRLQHGDHVVLSVRGLSALVLIVLGLPVAALLLLRCERIVVVVLEDDQRAKVKAIVDCALPLCPVLTAPRDPDVAPRDRGLPPPPAAFLCYNLQQLCVLVLGEGHLRHADSHVRDGMADAATVARSLTALAQLLLAPPRGTASCIAKSKRPRVLSAVPPRVVNGMIPAYSRRESFRMDERERWRMCRLLRRRCRWGLVREVVVLLALLP